MAYPREEGYVILSEKHVKITETVTGLDFSSNAVLSNKTEKITYFVDNAGYSLLIIIPIIAAVLIIAIFILKKRK